MTRINVYRTSAGFSKFFIAFGSIFALLGIYLFINAMVKGFDAQFPSGDWNSVTFTVQGILFIIMGASNLYVRKYLIEWDDNEIRFLLPDTKRLEKVNLDDILSVNIRLFEIELILKDQKRILDLNNLQFEDLKKIKTKFETLKTT